MGDSTLLGRVRDDVTGPNQDERRVGVDEGNAKAEEYVLHLAVLRGDHDSETNGSSGHRDGNVVGPFLEAIRRDRDDENTDHGDHVDLKSRMSASDWQERDKGLTGMVMYCAVVPL